MEYSNFKDLKLSKLGFGTMRLPIVGDDYSKIDVEKTRECFKYAIENGINYFDTAWMYHDHNSENVVGTLLKEFDRKKYYIASKFPGFSKEDFDKIDETFNEQLRKTGLDYFDFYLFHNVSDRNVDFYLENYNGIIDYFKKKKEEGKIKHLGISTHGSIPCLEKFLNKYSNLIEFVQIQLNFLDYKYQNAKTKVEILNKFDKPIWVMEPVRGGTLSDLGQYNNKLKELKPNDSISSWSFRFISSLKGVTVILSGMSNLEQVKDNVKTFNNNPYLNTDEFSLMLNIADDLLKNNTIPCTACNYCKDVCPKNIAISQLFKGYNDGKLNKRDKLNTSYFKGIDESQFPDNCIECHACEKVCPQKLEIPELLKKVNEYLN